MTNHSFARIREVQWLSQFCNTDPSSFHWILFTFKYLKVHSNKQLREDKITVKNVSDVRAASCYYSSHPESLDSFMITETFPLLFQHHVRKSCTTSRVDCCKAVLFSQSSLRKTVLRIWWVFSHCYKKTNIREQSPK